ncbi:MAG TPA: NAD-dependent epimerase/dehydratase family protein, partial [Bryobacteraceae bacterium]|nr:NAD-dependent epimerase/dehydratase family protein [Bryobacteraceae bacterium]
MARELTRSGENTCGEDDLNTRTALIVGGAGYIGSHTAKWLHKAGWNVCVLDNLSRGNRW